MKPNRKRKCGFTLLEIVVSIGILSLLALMLTRVFNESSRAVGQGREQSLLDATARMVLDALERDIGQALIRTNVAFRTTGDSLYFVSPAAQFQWEGIFRDTAPMKWKTAGSSLSNQSVSVELPHAAVENMQNRLADLIQHSDYYSTDSGQQSNDFMPIHHRGTAPQTRETEYIPSAGSASAQQTALTFLNFAINGDASWTGLHAGSGGTAERPRFVDVTIGLVDAATFQLALQMNTAQGDAHIEKNERIYTRRILLRNTGTDPLENWKP
jgi:prepilin-type N-terminal cleavage/methylation domain-containing protein